MANRISTLIDFDTRGGVKSISQLRTEIKNTDGALGKMKVGAKGMGDALKANVGPAAIAAGASLVAFGVKAVGSFTDAAIAAGNFADSTGTSVEQASQWLSVADDLGLSGDTLQKSFLKMNKTIGDGGPIVEKYGLSLQTTADGAADVNGTMLKAIEVIGGIKDPTERATAAQEVFGRSYAEVAEIVLGNADDIRAGLESTSNAQIIDEAELKKARDYRAAMDQLNDVFTDITMVVGSALTPALTDAADAATDISTALDSIPGLPKGLQWWWDNASPLAWVERAATPFKMLGNALGFGGDQADEFRQSTAQAADTVADASRQMDDYVSGLEDSGRAQIDANSAVGAGARQMDEYVTGLKEAGDEIAAKAKADEDAAKAAQEHADAIADQVDAVDDLLGRLFDYEEGTIKLGDAVTDLADKTDGDLRLATIGAARDALSVSEAFATEQGALKGTSEYAALQRDELQRLAEKYPALRAEIAQYIAALGQIPRDINTTVRLSGGSVGTTNAAGQVTSRRAVGPGTSPATPTALAEGGIVRARPGGTLATIGEGGHDEAVIPLNGRNALGSSIVINVTAGMGANGAEIGRVIRDELLKLKRANGSLGLS